MLDLTKLVQELGITAEDNAVVTVTEHVPPGRAVFVVVNPAGEYVAFIRGREGRETVIVEGELADE